MTTSTLARRDAWAHTVQGAAALAAAMGAARFGFTPILPLMTAHAGLSVSAGATLATANYLGNFAGALLGTVAPALGRSARLNRWFLVMMTVALAAMPLTHSVAVWFVLRLLAGIASGAVFVFAVDSLLSRVGAHQSGWAFSGIGAGIALSGLTVLLVPSGDWRLAWLATAALAAVLTAVAWQLPQPVAASAETAAARPRTGRWFSVLFASYTLEGVGYIIAGTFLVAAISQASPGRLGSVAWLLVGLAAAPSAVGWALLSRRWSRPSLLGAALLTQAVGIALPALLGGAGIALIGAVLFGATFLGIANLALSTGAHLGFPRAVALLTAGYSLGQIIGPVAAAPLLRHGYPAALLLSAAIVVGAAVFAAVLRAGFPHRVH
ncbi:YbfB/YjiJ family MFS transporter [Amycolatopsis benzoatilytica]|uniref:YbfB/YjiJ family MFS transporter n=1 Tax=Amycolatopsis benzoatilytica TaxID=346045 RepID=UPI0003773E65|nr:YbfB/YjiJ family MFS transporter [Amycolatopsis benzoatilytica]